jgi:hypothetical protein
MRRLQQIHLLEHLRDCLTRKINGSDRPEPTKRNITILKIVRNGTSKAQNFKTAQKQT